MPSASSPLQTLYIELSKEPSKCKLNSSRKWEIKFSMILESTQNIHSPNSFISVMLSTCQNSYQTFSGIERVITQSPLKSPQFHSIPQFSFSKTTQNTDQPVKHRSTPSPGSLTSQDGNNSWIKNGKGSRVTDQLS
ncbi:hypothetical protein TIFTF001_018660 [Ficus carica]|uniref:Uncharacterized protein n=1 Tax=Ficus carica TaxID=3494 RepID=A0AA88ACX0_FICCA|nr:hypothetical protein TIFTF001_018660 [Ficus carica]